VKRIIWKYAVPMRGISTPLDLHPGAQPPAQLQGEASMGTDTSKSRRDGAERPAPGDRTPVRPRPPVHISTFQLRGWDSCIPRVRGRRTGTVSGCEKPHLIANPSGRHDNIKLVYNQVIEYEACELLCLAGCVRRCTRGCTPERAANGGHQHNQACPDSSTPLVPIFALRQRHL